MVGKHRHGNYSSWARNIGSGTGISFGDHRGYRLSDLLDGTGYSAGGGLCVGGGVIATDAVALSGIVGKGRIPKSIMGVLEGEALMNDASGLVALKFAIAVAMGTMIFTVSGATLEFLKVAIGGLLAGVAITWLYSKSLRIMSRWSGDDPATQIVLLLLLPFASYLVAEHLASPASWRRWRRG